MVQKASIMKRPAVLILAFGCLLPGVRCCYAAGDFDGDGKDDIITFIRDSYTGDGRGDVCVGLSTGQGFKSEKWHDQFCFGLEIPAVGNFNGDDKDDIVTFIRDTVAEPGRGDVAVALSTGSGFSGTGWKWHEFFCIGNEIPGVGDFDGDGKDDIITFVRDTQGEPGRGDVYVALSTGSGFGAGTKWHDFFCIGNEIPAVGNFDGDNGDDIITFIRDTKTGSLRGDVVVALSTGSSFGPGQIWHDFFCIGNEIPVVGDFNGDGKDDIATFVRDAWPEPERGDVYVALSDGSSFVGTGWQWHDGFCWNNQIPDSGDFDGDGKDDVLRFEHDTRLDYYRGDVYVLRSTGTNFEFAGLLYGKWHHYFCVLDEVPTTFAAVFPYYMFDSSFESGNAVFGCYPSNEESRFNRHTWHFKHEFEDRWGCAQYYWGYPHALAEDHLSFVDAVDIAYVSGHGSPGSITLCDGQQCDLTQCAWGSWSSNSRRGDLEYIAFESCQVTSLDGAWAERWISTPNKKGPFSGLHGACGFYTNHRTTPDFELSEEFAENLKDGFNVRWAWMEAADDENDWVVGHWNGASVIYLAPYKDEAIGGHTNYDFWYHNAEYVMHANYWKD